MEIITRGNADGCRFISQKTIFVEGKADGKGTSLDTATIFIYSYSSPYRIGIASGGLGENAIVELENSKSNYLIY